MVNSVPEIEEGELLIFRSYKTEDWRVWIDNQCWCAESSKLQVEWPQSLRLLSRLAAHYWWGDNHSLNNVACSHYPSIIESRHGSSSSSSQTLDSVLESPETPSPSDDRTAPSSPLHVFVSDDSNSPIYTAQRHLVSSPTVDTRRLHALARSWMQPGSSPSKIFPRC